MSKLRSIRLPGGGRVAYLPSVEDAEITANMLFATRLYAAHRDAHGHLITDNKDKYELTKLGYDLGSGLVTTAGVTLLAADWTNATATLKLANFHDSGTGVTAAAIGDTAMGTVDALHSGRQAGTQTNPSAGVYKSVGTLTYTGGAAITEWGLFTVVTAATPTLWDRKVFSAINVVSTDSIAFSYSLTVTAGG